MAAYEYLALTETGKRRKGIIEGDTPRRARQSLREMGLAPLTLEPVTTKSSKLGPKRYNNHISLKNLALLSRQLSVLLRSGHPVEEALQILSEQTENRRVRRLIAGIRTQVLEGQSLAAAIEQYPAAFPPMYRATIEAGESSGQLDGILARMTTYLEKKEKVRQKLQLAMIYPLFLTIISILVVLGLLTFVVPEIVGVFNNLDQELPALTKALIVSSDWFKQYGVYLIGGILVIWALARQALKIESVSYKYHSLLLKIPFFGRLSRGLNTANFTRTLAILNGSGVELLEALRIAAMVTPNLAMRQAIDKAAVKVREGSTLGQSLAQSRIFPPIVIHLIGSGESSGQLAEMLENAADDQESEVQSISEMTLGILEPLLILVMGGVVLTIVMAILMPIFDMNQLIH
jgi:general secretion pathway protein F